MNGPVTVRVAHGHQVTHEGTVHRSGDTAVVPVHIATEWLEAGWAVSHVSDNTDAKPATG